MDRRESVSLFCTRVLLAAQVKGIALPLEPLRGGNVGSAAFSAINPIGRMPGPWWRNVQRAPTWTTLLAKYRAELRAFMGL